MLVTVPGRFQFINTNSIVYINLEAADKYCLILKDKTTITLTKKAFSKIALQMEKEKTTINVANEKMKKEIAKFINAPKWWMVKEGI